MSAAAVSQPPQSPPKPPSPVATKPPAPPAPLPSRMQFSALVRGKQSAPRRVVIYGPEGIGKSTFARDALRPVFIDIENGTLELDVVRFPRPPAGWALPDVYEAIEFLRTNTEHDFATLAIDVIDALEAVIWAHLCKREKKSNIEAFGYGKGYQAALDEWRVLLGKLERLQLERQMGLVLVGHSFVKTFKNPEGPDFDRYNMKIHEKPAGLLREWSDAVLFACYETFAEKVDDKDRKGKGFSTGARVIRTLRTAAYDAKNRYSLPEELPLSYADFDAACRAHQPADPDELIAAIRARATELGGPKEAETLASLERVGRDAQKLSQLNNWCNAKVAEKARKEG